MNTRALLGVADVGDEELDTMVASLLGEERVEILDLAVSVVDYDLPSITTAGRYWVSGHAATANGPKPFRIFVKHVQCWSRSPLFASVPPEIREMAAAGVPWRTEPLVYRSELAERLPTGLSMPTVLGVYDLDELSASMWLAEVPATDWPWDVDRYRRAAYLLGRLAGSPTVAPLADLGAHAWTVRDYLEGRFRHQVVPMLDDDRLWSHPLLAHSFGPELRHRMRNAAVQAPRWVAELDGAPLVTGHGDACPNNLMGAPHRDNFVLIDFGFWKPLPLGFDLGQLVLGEVQLGRRPAATLAETDAAVVPEYVQGLAAEGMVVDPALVNRLHALQMLIFSGLSSMPFEHLQSPPSPQMERLASDRATLATYCLDLVESTG
ncbi:phosphotransferase [Lapillicoccus sp.]|uniref:phosphotransferase n=1 Tax=Lapillicoccus sp. TaxID=1909287 RepID=UPI003264A697